MGTVSAPYGTTTPVATSFLFQVVGTPNSTPSLSQQSQNLAPNSLQVLQLDAAIRVSHTSRAQITEHPVEYGSDVTDNARPLPDELQVEGFISGTPLGVQDQFGDNAEFPVNGNPAVKAAFDTLRNLKDTATVIDVVTRLHEYPNMLMQDLEFLESADIGDSLRFTCRMKAVRIISSQTVTPPAAVKHAQGKASQGKKVTAPATPQQETSAAFDLVQAVSGGSPTAAPLNGGG